MDAADRRVDRGSRARGRVTGPLLDNNDSDHEHFRNNGNQHEWDDNVCDHRNYGHHRQRYDRHDDNDDVALPRLRRLAGPVWEPCRRHAAERRQRDGEGIWLVASAGAPFLTPFVEGAVTFV